MLRTRFATVEGRPVGVARPHTDVPLPVITLTALPAEDREAALRRSFEDDLRRSFDLSEDPPLRARLFELAPEAHVLLVVIHHIATDGTESRTPSTTAS